MLLNILKSIVQKVDDRMFRNDRLLAEIGRLEAQNMSLRVENAELKEEIQDLAVELVNLRYAESKVTH